MRRQIKDYIEVNHYSYSGILRTLKYFYEVKHNSIDKSNDGIGIVPWVYNEAYRYYYAIWAAQQKNEGKTLEKLNGIEVIIKPPKRKPARKRKFRFLDEEYVDNE